MIKKLNVYYLGPYKINTTAYSYNKSTKNKTDNYLMTIVQNLDPVKKVTINVVSSYFKIYILHKTLFCYTHIYIFRFYLFFPGKSSV